MVLYGETHVFLPLRSKILFGRNREPISTFKYLSCRKYFFQKQTQFLQVNNVLDGPASKTDGFL
jgi:hypothetical protein